MVQNGVFVIAEKFATQLTEEYLAETSGKGLKQNQIQAVLGGGWKSKAHKDCELTHFEFISEPNVIQEESPEEDIN